MTPINYKWVGKAIQYYTDNEFNYIEAPWIITPQALNVTLPRFRDGFKVVHPNLELGYLVGSAEQGFIQMMIDGNLSKGKYCAAGPCFRDEAITNEWQLFYFFKVELIEVNPNSKNVFEIIEYARDFMENIGNCKIQIEKTLEGFDLFCKGIELGSYGHRTYKDYNWTYGTGLALPRFSQVLGLKDEEKFFK